MIRPVRAGIRAGELIAAAFPTVRSRFIGLLLLASIPLFAMAASIAVQNYHIVADATRQRVILAREAATARYDTFLAETARLLMAVAATPFADGGTPADCEAFLRTLLTLPGDRYADIGVLDPQGALRCAGLIGTAERPRRGDDFSTDTIFRDAQVLRGGEAGTGLAVGAIRASRADGRPLVPVAVAIRRGGQFRGVVAAGIRIAWIPGAAPRLHAAWVEIGSDLVALGATTDSMLPTAAGLLRVRDAADGVLVGRGRDGRPYVYAEMRLPGGPRLLFAESATDDLAHATTVLGRRLAELSLLLLAGLAAVGLGADLAITRPLQHVTDAVARWRAGGHFEAPSGERMPAEIDGLSTAFATASQALTTREAQLRAATAQQELLMQEIHHRVKNNLQIIASLLNLQASRIRLPEARAEFQAARDRIRALATLHRHLYAHGELHTINMRGFLEELCQQLMQALGEPPNAGRIALQIEAPELRISSDQAVPIALIVTEAVSNAVKYAFPGGRGGHVAVRLRMEEGEGREVARLTIDDDGIGIPVGRAETEAGVRDGIGIQLIRGFARQLGAELTVTEAGGTHYALAIPLRRERVETTPLDQPAPAKPG